MRNNWKKILCIFCVFAVVFSTFIAPIAQASNRVEPVDEVKPIESETVVVSLGDSYSSGEGIPEFYGTERNKLKSRKNDDWLAHRSKLSWSGQLVVDGVTLNEHKDQSWFFVASSGATTSNLLGKQKKKTNVCIYESMTGARFYSYEEKDLDPQLNVFNNIDASKIKYVTMTMGGNDAGFSNIVVEAVKGDADFLIPNELSDRLNNTWNEFYDAVNDEKSIREKLKKAYKDIEDKVSKNTTIVIAGYPKLIDEDGFNLFKGNLFKKEYAEMVNDSVSRFNLEIKRLVEECQRNGMNIKFVSVEEAFEGHAAGSSKPFLNGLVFPSQSQDLDDSKLYSDYSMHPNEEGAKIYAKIIQDAFDELEKQSNESANNVELDTPTETDPENASQHRENEREVVLVLDESGSMDSKLDKTIEAANKFIDTMTKNDVRVALVTYSDNSVIQSAFSKDKKDLEKRVQRINPNGGTNIESGLKTATSLLRSSDAKKRIIVLMSDGEANTGLVSDELIEYAKQIKDKEILIYTLGFFDDVDNVSEAQRVMEGIANPGCHYEVDDPNGLVFFFGDIAEQINGEKYIYVRIACPVDVEVEYNNEKLTSDSEIFSRTSFGSITFEENSNSKYSDKSYIDDRIKVLRLKEGPDYNINISGTAQGTMDYSIKLANEYGEYIDSRDFFDVEINNQTIISTVANTDEKSVLKIDAEGDGEYDLIYEAESNSEGKLIEEDIVPIVEKKEEPKNNWKSYVIFAFCVGILLSIMFLMIKKLIYKKRNYLIDKYSNYLKLNK